MSPLSAVGILTTTCLSLVSSASQLTSVNGGGVGSVVVSWPGDGGAGGTGSVAASVGSVPVGCEGLGEVMVVGVSEGASSSVWAAPTALKANMPASVAVPKRVGSFM